MRSLLTALLVLTSLVIGPASAAQPVPLLAGDTQAGDRFGGAVAVDGDRALVSARSDVPAGSATVFARSGGVWVPEARLTPDTSTEFDNFGFSVSLDGDRALVGAVFDGDAGQFRGAAYVFARQPDGAWVQEAKLTAADDAASQGEFGWSVSLDGGYALVGALADGPLGFRSGAAYVFARDAAGAWTQQAKLFADDGMAFDGFGASVALDGDRALLGSSGHDEGGENAGAAYVFVRTAETWTLDDKLTASVPAAGEGFGGSVALSGDRALIGAGSSAATGAVAGAAYVFDDADDVWTQSAVLTADDGAEGDAFGIAVALDGSVAVVGAPRTDGGGAAYVFSSAGGAWTQQSRTESPSGADSQFGQAVAVSAGTGLIGAPSDAALGPDAGAAYALSGLPVASAAPPMAGLALSAPRPNPSTDSAVLRLTLAAPTHVRAAVYDALGRQMAVIADGEMQGATELRIDTHRLAAGVYVVRVEGESFAEARRLTVVR